MTLAIRCLSLLVLFGGLTGCAIIEDDGGASGRSNERLLPEVDYSVESNPPDCRNASEMNRTFDRVECIWECARHKSGGEGREVHIVFEPRGSYTDKEIRSWHIVSEEINLPRGWKCPDGYEGPTRY